MLLKVWAICSRMDKMDVQPQSVVGWAEPEPLMRGGAEGCWDFPKGTLR